MNLLEACSIGNIQQISQICKSKKLRHQITLHDNHNWTPLHHAVAYGSAECLKIVLSTPGLDVKAKTYEGLTALHVACTKNTISIEIVEMLVEKEPQLVNMVNNEEVSPLLNAIESNRMDIIKLLVQHGALVNYIDLDGEHSLIYAVRQMNLEIIQYLLKETDCNQFLMNTINSDALEIAIATKAFNKYRDLKKCNECIDELLKYRCETTFNGEFLDRIFRTIKLCLSTDQRDDLRKFIEVFYLCEKNSKKFLVEKLFRLKNSDDLDWYRLIFIMHDSLFREHMTETINFFNSSNFIFEILYFIFETDTDFFYEIFREIVSKIDIPDRITFANKFFNFLYKNMESGHCIKKMFRFVRTFAEFGLNTDALLRIYCLHKNISFKAAAHVQNTPTLIVLLPLVTVTDIQESHIECGVLSLVDLSRIRLRQILIEPGNQNKSLARVMSLPVSMHLKRLILFYHPAMESDLLM